MKHSRRILSLILCACIALPLLSAVLLPFVGATAADDLEDRMLGKLSEQYESNGQPGLIADTAGDPGGKSYGLYMFASNAGTPKAFFEWCQESSNAYYRGIGNTLSEAYYYISPGYGSGFDAAWRQLAQENPDGFGRCQRDFVRSEFYDLTLDALAEKVPGFDVSNYSIALRNVIWSRSIQHGPYSAANVCQRAFDAIGGFTNQPESELINAIYAESGRLTDDASTTMVGALARSYGVEGYALAYYTGCSADVQLGVYIRLRINEPANAQIMLAEYGYNDAALGDGSYLICPVSNTKLAVTADSSGLSINERKGGDNQQFRLDFHASGYYTLTNGESGLRLAAASGSVALAQPSAEQSQLWALVRSGSTFALQNRATGQYLTASTFAAGGRVSAGDEAVQWQVVPGAANWTLTGASYPTYANGLEVGSSSFPFRGTLRSTYVITAVRAEIRRADTVLYSASAKPGVTYYDLSEMDSAMAFSRLSAGNYSLVITADDASGSHFELNSPFYVSDGTTYVVTFDPAGGTCSVASRPFTPGQMFGELPVPTRSGYNFLGWYTDDGTRVTATSITPAHNLTLTARYSREYAYTFYDYDGKTVLASGKLAEGQPIPRPADPVRPSTDVAYYTFSHWEGYTDGMTMGTRDVAFTAVYDEHPISTEEVTEMTATGSYRLADGYLRVIPAGTTAQQILDTLVPRESIAIHSGSTVVTGAVGTGMTVDFAPNGQVVQTAVIVVTGDVNGDGKITLTDMVQIRSHLLGRTTLKGAYLQAADLNGDGSLTLTDMVQLRAFMLGRSQIIPR